MAWINKRKNEISDIYYDDAVVYKDYKPTDDQMISGLTIGIIIGSLGTARYLRRIMSSDEKYNLNISDFFDKLCSRKTKIFVLTIKNKEIASLINEHTLSYFSNSNHHQCKNSR